MNYQELKQLQFMTVLNEKMCLNEHPNMFAIVMFYLIFCILYTICWLDGLI